MQDSGQPPAVAARPRTDATTKSLLEPGSLAATLDRYKRTLGAAAVACYRLSGGHFRLVEGTAAGLPPLLRYVAAADSRPFEYRNECLAVVVAVPSRTDRPHYPGLQAAGVCEPDGELSHAVVAFYSEAIEADRGGDRLLLAAREIEALLLRQEVERLIHQPFIYSADTLAAVIEPTWRACDASDLPLSLVIVRMMEVRAPKAHVRDMVDNRNLRARTACLLRKHLIDSADTLLAGPAGEFMLLLRGRGSIDARAMCNDLLESSNRCMRRLLEGTAVGVRYSFGVAAIAPSGPYSRIALTRLLARANAAVRSAEDEGGNRVKLAPD